MKKRRKNLKKKKRKPKKPRKQKKRMHTATNGPAQRAKTGERERNAPAKGAE